MWGWRSGPFPAKCNPTPPFRLSTPPPAWPSGGYAVAKTSAFFPCHAPSALTRGAVPRGGERLIGVYWVALLIKGRGKEDCPRGARGCPIPLSTSPWPSPLPVSCASLATQLSGRAQLRGHPTESALLPLARREVLCTHPVPLPSNGRVCRLVGMRASPRKRHARLASTVLYMYKMSSEMGAFVPTWRPLSHLHLFTSSVEKISHVETSGDAGRLEVNLAKRHAVCCPGDVGYTAHPSNHDLDLWRGLTHRPKRPPAVGPVAVYVRYL